MDLRLLYSNFVMDNRELVFHTTPDATNMFQDDRGFTHCAITAFQNGDPDIAWDPLSTNRRLADSPGLQMFRTKVVSGRPFRKFGRTSSGCRPHGNFSFWDRAEKLEQCVCLPGPLLYYRHTPAREK